MKVRSFLIEFVIILIFSFSAVAQQPANVQLTGRILDPMGALISGISVSAYSQTKTKYEAYADDNGVYSLNLPEGIYNLEINKQYVKYNAFEVIKFNNYQVVSTQDQKLNFDIVLPIAGNGILCVLDVSDSSQKSKQSKKKQNKTKRKNN